MKHKVFGLVFVLAIALGMISVTVRAPQTTPAAQNSVQNALPASKPDLSRPLACYRVHEEGVVDGMNYTGAGYSACVSETEVRFGSALGSIHLGAPRIEQGPVSIDCTKAEFQHPAYAVARLERGPVTEEYVFENRRVEQLFRLAKPLGEGDLRVRIPVRSDFGGEIETHSPASGKFEAIQFQNGGIAFHDESGEIRASYYSAVAVDADGRKLALGPRYENGEILLEVPTGWLGQAAYPVVIDPWLELASSGSGGGVTNTQAVADRPSIAMTGSGNPFLCWSDNTVGNYEVYVTYWNGFRFTDLGGSSHGAGISSNSGDSVNPQIAVSDLGIPYVCWEDNTEGRVGIYFRRWNGDSLTWEELDNSASKGGLSVTFTGPALHPHLVVASAFLQKVTSPLTVSVPVIVWEEANNVQCFWHYDGDDRATPGQAGWYNIGPVNTPAGASAGWPSIALDLEGRPVVAWHDSSSGDFEIYVRRFQDVTTPGNAGLPMVLTGEPRFVTEIQVSNGTIEFAGWVGIGGSDAAGGVSATPTQLSQYPSVCCDGNNISVAWMETLPGGPTGTNHEIYASRSDGTNPFVFQGNVSNTPGDSMSPSIDATFGRMVVAWSENPAPTLTNPTPNTEIYLRSRVSGAPAGWLQIGVQGSAAPLVGADTVQSEGGVSNTPNSSLSPQVKVDSFGNPTVVWADGAQGKLDIFLRTFSPNGPGNMVPNATTGQLDFVPNLRQTFDNPVTTPGTTDVPVAQPVTNTTLYFSANVFTEVLAPAGTSLVLQVEVAEASTDFTGTKTFDSLPVAPGALAVVQYTGLVNRNYHWQARTIDQFGRFSPWIVFSTIGGVSFQISSTVPTSGTPNTAPIIAGSTKSSGHCGLLGLEAVALLGLIRVIRRKPSI